jgi:hypothetical protein
VRGHSKGFPRWAIAVGRPKTCFRPERGILIGAGACRVEGGPRLCLRKGREGSPDISCGYMPAKLRNPQISCQSW